MKLVFCGTPLFAVPTLERLAAAGHELQLVVTQPDRPQGRGMELTAPPGKTIRAETRPAGHPAGKNQEERRLSIAAHSPQA